MEDVGDLALGDRARAHVAEALETGSYLLAERMRSASSSSPRAMEDVGDLALGGAR